MASRVEIPLSSSKTAESLKIVPELRMKEFVYLGSAVVAENMQLPLSYIFIHSP